MAEQYALLHQGQKYGGKSVADWTIEWWKWASDLPDGDNPFNDETGDLAIQGDIGSVVFLASTISTTENPTSSSAERTFSVTEGDALLLPILNIAVTYPGQTKGAVEKGLNGYLGLVTDLHASIDGTPIDHLSSYFVKSDFFSYGTLTEGDLSTLGYEGFFYTDQGNVQPEVGAELAPAKSAGWWLFITGLSPGEHELEVGGTFDFGESSTFTTAVVDHITVVSA